MISLHRLINMKTIFYIFFFLISLTAICQSDTVFIRHKNYETSDTSYPYKTDTIIFQSTIPGRFVLCGTKILPTGILGWLGDYGLNLEAVSRTDCKDHEPFSSGNEVESINKTDSTLEIETKIISNCCYSFLCDIPYNNDTILNLVYYGYGSYCSCDCCFGLTYRFKKEPFLGDIQRKFKYVMINGDKKTMKPLK